MERVPYIGNKFLVYGNHPTSAISLPFRKQPNQPEYDHPCSGQFPLQGGFRLFHVEEREILPPISTAVGDRRSLLLQSPGIRHTEAFASQCAFAKVELCSVLGAGDHVNHTIWYHTSLYDNNRQWGTSHGIANQTKKLIYSPALGNFHLHHSFSIEGVVAEWITVSCLISIRRY